MIVTSVSINLYGWRRWLKGHAKPLEEIADANQLWRGQLHVELEVFEAVTESLKKVENKLDKLGACDERIKRLQTIRGAEKARKHQALRKLELLRQILYSIRREARQCS